MLSVHVHLHVSLTCSIHYCYSYCTATAGQIARQVDFAVDRDPAIDKGSRSLTTGEKRRTLHPEWTTRTRLLLSLLSSATSLRLQPARHRIVFILSRRNDSEAKRSIPSHAGTAQTLERAVPFPSRQLPNYHPLRSNSQDESLARTDLLYPALYFLPERRRDRETTAHEQHSYPTHTFEDTDPQLSLSTTPVARHRYHQSPETS